MSSDKFIVKKGLKLESNSTASDANGEVRFDGTDLKFYSTTEKTLATTADISAHTGDTTDAHAASAITNTPAGGIAATTVQAAIDELDGDKVSKVSSTDEAVVRFNGITGAVQDSGVTIDDTNNMIVPGNLRSDGATIDLADATTASIATTNTASTINIGSGSGANTINIGGASSTVNITGSVNNQNVTNLNVSDKLITINDGGGAASGGAAGIEIEENSSVTGYIKTSSDRNSFEIKAPNTNGVASITPGASGGAVIINPMTTGGDIIYGGASGTPTRLANGSSGQVLTSAGGTSAPTWATPASAPTSPDELYNVGLACSVAGNALTIALKQADGVSDPSTGASAVKIAFRSTTTTAGSHTEVSATSATSITVSSGSTLGHTSAKTHYIWVYAINNSGTIELAVSSTLQDTNTVITTTAEGGTGTADSASVVYSTTSRTNVAARLIGRLQSNQTTAGTWAAVPTQISLDPSSITLSPNSFLPTGMVSPFAGTSAPNGWLLCDGSAVSRSTYAALFAVIGTTWGTGDGSTTFNVPNTSGIFIRGAGSQTISSITHTAAALGSTQNDQMQGHKHTVYWQDNNDYARTAGSQGVQQLSNTNIDTSSTSDVPVTDGTNGTPRTGSTTYPANITMNHIIKY